MGTDAFVLKARKDMLKITLCKLRKLYFSETAKSNDAKLPIAEKKKGKYIIILIKSQILAFAFLLFK